MKAEELTNTAEKINEVLNMASEKMQEAAEIAAISVADKLKKHEKIISKNNYILFFIIGVIVICLIFSIFKLNKGISNLADGQKIIQREIFKLSNNDSIMNIQLQHYPAALPIPISKVSRVSSTYSERIDPISGQKQFHYGIDYAVKKGTEVYATADGIVKESGLNNNFGNTVKIDHLNEYESLYGHLSKILVQKGQNVKRGDIIGLIGNTGKSTGPHLHYEILFRYSPINPIIFNKNLI